MADSAGEKGSALAADLNGGRDCDQTKKSHQWVSYRASYNCSCPHPENWSPVLWALKVIRKTEGDLYWCTHWVNFISWLLVWSLTNWDLRVAPGLHGACFTLSFLTPQIFPYPFPLKPKTNRSLKLYCLFQITIKASSLKYCVVVKSIGCGDRLPHLNRSLATLCGATLRSRKIGAPTLQGRFWDYRNQCG